MAHHKHPRNVKKLLESIVSTIVDFHLNPGGAPLQPLGPIGQLNHLFQSPLPPTQGLELEKALELTLGRVVANSQRVSDPRFVGHMTGPTPLPALLADLLVSATNQNVVKMETAPVATALERQLLAWLHHLVYQWPQSVYQEALVRGGPLFGSVTSGGTLGNLTALTLARNRAWPSAHKEGLARAWAKDGTQRAVVFASQRVHYSIRKVCGLLGLGTDAVVSIPVDGRHNTISLAHLDHAYDGLPRGTRVLAIVGVAGTTETGNIDPLEELANRAQKWGAWFHADAAWGGGLLTHVPSRGLLKGIELADSVVVDAHKLLMTPMSLGLVLVKDPQVLGSLTHHAAYIIREGSADLGRTSLEGSRRFSALPLWTLWQALGTEGLGQMVAQSLQQCAHLAAMVHAHPCFELTSAVTSNILTYRFLPVGWKALFEPWSSGALGAPSLPIHRGPLPPHLAQLNAQANLINTELHKILRDRGQSFVSRTTLESVFPGQETIVLRAVTRNPHTEPHHLADMLAEQANAGMRLYDHSSVGGVAVGFS